MGFLEEEIVSDYKGIKSSSKTKIGKSNPKPSLMSMLPLIMGFIPQKKKKLFLIPSLIFVYLLGAGIYTTIKWVVELCRNII